MKWMEARVVFEHDDPGMASELIADIFHDLGLQGVVVESTTPDPDLDWAGGVPKTHDADAVVGYIDVNAQYEERIASLETGVRELDRRIRLNARIDYAPVDDEDWAEAWKAYFFPEKVGKRIVVKPTWRDYVPAPGEIVVEIDPGMAFGTGTHPTTALCVRALERHLAPGATVLDVGTGSGILMVAAHRLGAGEMWGVDSDAVATDVAAENLRLNRLPPEVYTIRTGNLADTVDRTFDVVVANILTHVIVELLDDLPRVLKPNGIFIGSGIIVEHRETVTEKMVQSGFEVVEVAEREGWIAAVGCYAGG